MRVLVSSALVLWLFPRLSLASPPTEPANFASASLLAFQVLLGSSTHADPAEVVHAARDRSRGPQGLLDLVPAACDKVCSDYATFEVACMTTHTNKDCGEAFCTLDRIDGYIGCLNCLILVGNTTTISRRRFPTAATQLTLLQNACTQEVTLLAPQVRLLPYSSIGKDPTGGQQLNAASLASAESSTSDAERRMRIGQMSLACVVALLSATIAMCVLQTW